MTRAAAAVLALLLLGGCSGPRLDAEHARRAVARAAAAADLEASDVGKAELRAVDGAGGVQIEVWLVDVTVDEREWKVGVDPVTGAIVRTFEPPGSELTAAQVRALSEHRFNPAADAQHRRLVRALLAVAALGLVGGYLVLRLLARRHPHYERPDPDQA